MSANEISKVSSQLAKASVSDDFELSFAGQALKLDGEKEAQEIVDAINGCDNLKALRLQGNTLGIEAAKYIAKALEKHPEFERALWSDLFTGRLKSEIPDALRHLGDSIIRAGARLTVLDLSDNAFGPNGMNGLTDFLVSSSCYGLQELRLHNNGLGVTGGKMLAKCLLDCHRSSVKAGTPLALKVFISGRGRLENEGSIALAEAFKAMGSLEEVQMPQNGIYHPGITALADAFAHNKNLRHLNMQDNTFTSVGATAMAKALPHLQKLEIINFADCLLRDKGARILAKAFKNHTQLREVSFCANEVRSRGARDLTEALAGKPQLEKLDMGCNELGETAIEVMKGLLDEKEDVLNVSDDEGTPDPSEDEGEEEEDEEEGGEERDDPGLQVQGVAITPRQPAQPVSAADFLAFPSPTKLSSLGKDRARSIVEQIGDDIDDMDHVLKTFVKLSSFVKAEDEETKKLACECADELLSTALEDKEEYVTINFSNALLVHLGILKSEDKKFRAPSNITGPLIVLQHAVQQSYFPKTTRDFLQAFLGKPHPVLDAHSKPRHALLQTLYKF